jgi:hypothetical protein
LGGWFPMTALKARWDPARRYRSFVNRPLGMVTVVSSTLSDEAQGWTVGPLLIVLDSQGYVCDLELRLPEESALVPSPEMRPQPPDEPQRVHGPVTTGIDTADAVTVALDSDWLVVRLSNVATGRWYQLGEQQLYLSLERDRLVALAVREPTDDPDGKAEGSWLDELDGGRNAEEQGVRVER